MKISNLFHSKLKWDAIPYSACLQNSLLNFGQALLSSLFDQALYWTPMFFTVESRPNKNPAKSV